MGKRRAHFPCPQRRGWLERLIPCRFRSRPDPAAPMADSVMIRAINALQGEANHPAMLVVLARQLRVDFNHRGQEKLAQGSICGWQQALDQTIEHGIIGVINDQAMVGCVQSHPASNRVFQLSLQPGDVWIARIIGWRT